MLARRRPQVCTDTLLAQLPCHLPTALYYVVINIFWFQELLQAVFYENYNQIKKLETIEFMEKIIYFCNQNDPQFNLNKSNKQFVESEKPINSVKNISSNIESTDAINVSNTINNVKNKKSKEAEKLESQNRESLRLFFNQQTENLFEKSENDSNRKSESIMKCFKQVKKNIKLTNIEE